MIGFVTGGRGDWISYMAALQTMYALDPKPSRLVGCDEILPLYPERFDWLASLPDRSQQNVYHIDATEIERDGIASRRHPATQAFIALGLDPPCKHPRPEIVVDPAPAYDYVVAPWSASPSRSLTNDAVQRLVDALLPASVAIVGAACAPVVRSATPERGRPWRYVAGVIKNAKRAVITVDSACNRLAYALDIKNHVIIANLDWPIEWVGYDGATTVFREMRETNVDDVLDAIRA